MEGRGSTVVHIPIFLRYNSCVYLHLMSDAKAVEMAANFVRVGDGNLNIALFLLTDTGSQIDEATKVKVLYGGCAWGRLDVVKTIVEEHNLDPNSELYFYQFYSFQQFVQLNL